MGEARPPPRRAEGWAFQHGVVLPKRATRRSTTARTTAGGSCAAPDGQLDSSVGRLRRRQRARHMRAGRAAGGSPSSMRDDPRAACLCCHSRPVGSDKMRVSWSTIPVDGNRASPRRAVVLEGAGADVVPARRQFGCWRPGRLRWRSRWLRSAQPITNRLKRHKRVSTMTSGASQREVPQAASVRRPARRVATRPSFGLQRHASREGDAVARLNATLTRHAEPFIIASPSPAILHGVNGVVTGEVSSTRCPSSRLYLDVLFSTDRKRCRVKLATAG